MLAPASGLLGGKAKLQMVSLTFPDQDTKWVAALASRSLRLNQGLTALGTHGGGQAPEFSWTVRPADPLVALGCGPKHGPKDASIPPPRLPSPRPGLAPRLSAPSWGWPTTTQASRRPPPQGGPASPAPCLPFQQRCCHYTL